MVSFLSDVTVANVILPVPVFVAEILSVHPLPAHVDTLPLQTEPVADFPCSSGIEVAQEGQVHLVLLTKLLGLVPRHWSLTHRVP